MGNKQDKLISAIEDPAKSINDIKRLIHRGASVNRPHDGFLPLHCVCIYQDIDCLKLLLHHGAKVNKVNRIGNTALHCMAKTNSSESCSEIVKVLIQNGADINARNIYKDTPLKWAVHLNNIQCVKILLQHGADTNVRDKNNQTLLHWTVDNDDVQWIQLLLQNGADINIRNGDNNTPLHTAVYYNKVEFGKLLLQHGADTNIRDKNNQTLLQWAVETNNLHWIQLLLQHGANVDAQDNNHSTVLSKAASHCHLEIIKILLDYSANANNINLDRQTPVIVAAVEVSKLKTENNAECLELLIQASGQFHLPDGLIQHIAWNNELSKMLLPYCVHPRSLQVLCRYQIRSNLQNQFLPDVITSLNLPPTLQRFVLLRR